jgi:hypothetical protein
VPNLFEGGTTTDPAVFEPSTSTFYIARHNAPNEAVQFGIGTKYGGSPVVAAADYDGDGLIDPAVFEPSTSTFYIARSKLGNEAVQFGIGTKYGGSPVVNSADFDGDGSVDPAVFEPSTSTFYIARTHLGNEAVQFGIGSKFGGHPVPISAPLSPSTALGSVSAKGFALGSVISDTSSSALSAVSVQTAVHDSALEQHVQHATSVVSHRIRVPLTGRVTQIGALHDLVLATFRVAKSRRGRR